MFLPDARLRLVAQMIPHNSVVADVGTDHACLPVFLVNQGIIKNAIASDVRVGPLDSARRNIAEAGLEAQIETRLSDGLDAYLPGEVNCVVMAGMGGLLMTQLLSKAEWLKNKKITLVLQPMTDGPLLRRFLGHNGFILIKERCAADSRHVYTVMQATYDGCTRNLNDFACFTGALLNDPGENEKRFLEKELNRLHKHIQGLSISGKNTSELQMLYDAVKSKMEEKL